MFNGTTDTTFEPNSDLTRAMLVTVLWRADGKPQTDFDIPFTDADNGEYYAEALRWAVSEGIVKGISDNLFAPNDSITREQTAAILFRYAQYKGTAPSGAWAIRLDYADTDKISDYALEAVMYCKLKGIMMGDENNFFSPQNNTTRAETSAVLQRYIETKIE
ncbi:MAG: S-layer homology domain-containing protein [Clostridiales bacterium]|nr:MAG: S-layer homology domain-containing protein [Clostridiales bacterium]